MLLVNKVNYIIGLTLQENNESLFVLHNKPKGLMGPNSNIRYPFSSLFSENQYNNEEDTVSVF